MQIIKVLIKVKASEKCYLHLCYFQSDGERVQIFPNDFHKSNQIEGGVVHCIPTSDYAFDLKVNAEKSKGMEMIKAVASLEELPEISGNDLGYGLRGIDIRPKQMMAKYRETKGVVEDMCTILVME